MEPSDEYVPGIPRGVSDRQCHSGSGYGYHHSKHAFRRSRRRSVHGPRNCERTDDLGFRDKPGYRRSPDRFRAAVPGRQIWRGRLPGLPQHPGVAGGREADRPGAFDPPGREAAPVAIGGLSAGSVQRSRQSKDGDLLRQPAVAVCSPGGASVAGFMLLGIVFAAMTFSWLVLYAVVLAKLGDRLRRPAVRRTIEGVT